MTATDAETVRQRISSAAASGLDAAGFSAAVLELLRRAVPYDSVCLATTDPATQLLTSTFKVDLPAARDDIFAHFEYEVDDVNHYRDLASQRRPVGVLALDTSGHPERSARYRDFLRPQFGIEHELRAVFRADRQCWGAIGLYRDSPGSGFSPAEADFVNSLTEVVGRGLRSAVVTSAATGTSDDAAGPAVLIVGRDGSLRSATPAAQQHLDWMSTRHDGAIPTALLVLVSAARGFRDGRIGTAPKTRIRSADGQWWVLHAAPLAATTGSTGDIVITIEPARPPDVVPLVVAAHGLTDREQEVVRLILAGVTTTQIAGELHLSPYTVQDHLKSIFAKAGVRSRRELTAQVFFDHYAPRLGERVGPSGWFAG